MNEQQRRRQPVTPELAERAVTELEKGSAIMDAMFADSLSSLEQIAKELGDVVFTDPAQRRAVGWARKTILSKVLPNLQPVQRAVEHHTDALRESIALSLDLQADLADATGE